MSRQVKFRQIDVKRALLAAKAAGLSIARCEIDTDGKIVVIFGDPETETAAAKADRALAEWDARNNRKALVTIDDNPKRKLVF